MARKRTLEKNVFVKPNEQNRAYSSYAMARKRRMKSKDEIQVIYRTTLQNFIKTI